MASMEVPGLPNGRSDDGDDTAGSDPQLCPWSLESQRLRLWSMAAGTAILLAALAFAWTVPPLRGGDPPVNLGVDRGNTDGLTSVDVVGLPAPTAAYTTFDGDQAHLSGFLGSPLVVNFWGSKCPPCLTEMPAFERVHASVGDRVALLGLAVQDSETSARDLASTLAISFDLGLDPTGDVFAASDGLVLPTTLFIDEEGFIVERHIGVLSEQSLRSKIVDHFGVS